MNTAFTLRRLAFAGVLSIMAVGGACAETDPAHVAAENAGSARFAVTNVPADVSCIRIIAAGNPNVHTLVDVTPGQTASFNLSGQPLGVVTFSAEAFPSICAVVGAGTVPTWISDPITVTLTAGVAAQISLNLHENGLSDVDIDFTSGLTCHAPALPCLVNADCCSGTCYPNGTCAGACSANGIACSQGADCCAGQCANNLCCVPQGNACGTGADCCSGNCAGGTCGGPVPGACGDGVLQAGEQCDDGNPFNGDGCSASCAVEAGYSCSGSPSVCQTPSCNDGILNGSESDVDCGGGACAPCANGVVCFGPMDCASGVCQFNICHAALCSDGIVGSGEQCDDGNTFSGDGCDVSCAVEPGWTCAGAVFSSCTTTCGDGIVAGFEACDDGNAVSGDGCSSFCSVEPAYVCVGSPSVCAPAGGCQTAADCPGQDTECQSRTCQAGICGVQFAPVATAVAAQVFGDCQTAVCDGTGNVVSLPNNTDLPIDANQCTDDVCAAGVPSNLPAPQGAACNQFGGTTCNGAGQCTVAMVCGDGIKVAPEQCDDGNAADGDGCSATCQIEAGYTCTTMIPSVCAPIIDCPAPAQLLVFTGTGLPLGISDNTTITNSINVAAPGNVVQAILQVDITHTYDADLDLTLRSPASAAGIDISSDNGGSGDNYTSTVFSDACSTPVTSSNPPFSGCYFPESPLSSFIGQPAAGVWVLGVHDDALADVGTLNAWTLTLCVQ